MLWSLHAVDAALQSFINIYQMLHDDATNLQPTIRLSEWLIQDQLQGFTLKHFMN